MGLPNQSFIKGCSRLPLSIARHLPSPRPPSELEPDRDLPVARVARRTGDSAEIGISQKRIGCPEANRVGEIEEFGSQFQFHSFPDREVLEEPHVSILYPLPSRIGGKTRSVPRHLVARRR